MQTNIYVVQQFANKGGAYLGATGGRTVDVKQARWYVTPESAQAAAYALNKVSHELEWLVVQVSKVVVV